jgi:hypothetical protein
MSWLPTMATRWAKQLSLSKEMNSDQDSKEKKNRLKTTNKKIVLSIIIIYFFQRCFKRCKPIEVLKISKS